MSNIVTNSLKVFEQNISPGSNITLPQMLNDACSAGKFGIEVAYKGYCEPTYEPTLDTKRSTRTTRFSLDSGDRLELECYFEGTPEPSGKSY